jgi:hypothetical protein
MLNIVLSATVFMTCEPEVLMAGMQLHAHHSCLQPLTHLVLMLQDQQACAAAATADETDAQPAAEQKPMKPNIVTSWGQGAAGKAAGRKSAAPAAAAAGAAAAAAGGGHGHADAPKAADTGGRSSLARHPTNDCA